MTDQNLVPPDGPDATQPPVPPTAAQQPYIPPQGYTQQPGYAQAPYVQTPYVQPGYPGYAPPPPRGLSITSMVLGIVGVLGSFVYGIGLFPVIAAIITAFIARKRQPQGRAFWLTGLITGWVGLFICIVWIVILVVLFSVFLNDPDFRRSVENGFNAGSRG